MTGLRGLRKFLTGHTRLRGDEKYVFGLRLKIGGQCVGAVYLQSFSVLLAGCGEGGGCACQSQVLVAGIKMLEG